MHPKICVKQRHLLAATGNGKGLSNASYDVYVSCNECGSVHPMGIGIHVDTGPADEQSIDEAYEKISLPPQIQAIEGHKTLCLKTGKWFVQIDLKEIFLKPREPSPELFQNKRRRDGRLEQTVDRHEGTS